MSTPEPSKLWEVRLLVAGLFAALLVLSYLSSWVRRNFIPWVWGMIYVMMAWSVLLAMHHQFEAGHMVGVIVAYAALTSILGLSVRSMFPVVCFLGYGLALTAVAVTVGPEPAMRPSILVANMGVLAFVVIVVVRRRLSVQERLRDREERLRGLANSLPGVIYQFSAEPDGTYGVRFVSEHAETLLGISADREDFYERFLQHVPAPHRDDLIDSINRAVKEENDWRFEMPFEKPSGDRIWLLGTSTPERSGDELIFNGVILDITERKRVEEELRRLQNFYEQVLEQVPIDLAVFSPDAEFEYLNPQSVSDPDMREWLYGRTNEDYCRYRGIDPDLGRKRDEAIRRTAQTKEPFEIEETLETNQGPRYFLRVHGPVTDLQGRVTHVVAFGLDITERKKHEQKLLEAKEEAERMNRLKTSFLANMSHEIRTPLTSIIGFAEAIGDEVSDRAEGLIPEFARRIEKSGHHLLETLEGVLNLSKLEAEEMELTPERVDLVGEVEEIADLFGLQAEEAGIDVLLEAASSPVWAHVDEGGLRIALRNLVSNALKYTGDEGTVWLRVREEQNTAAVEVEDNGIGMEADRVAELFEPFRQESEGVGREYDGTGLGLTVTKQVIDQMEGSIDIETEKGEGSCFIVRLPLASRERTDGAGVRKDA